MSMGFDYSDDFVIFAFNTNSSSSQGQKTTRTLGVDGTMTQWVERDGGGSNYSRTYVEVLLPGHFWWSPNGTYTSEQISSSNWTIDGDFSSNYSMNSSGGMNYSNPSITDMTHTHSGSSSSTLTQNGQTENWEASHDYTTTNSGNTLTTDITESSGTGTSYPDSYEVADPMAWLAGQIVQPFPAFNAGQLMNNLISSLVNRYGHWDNVPQELKDQLSGYFEEGIGWVDGPSQQASQIDALMRAMYEKIHSGDLALAGTPDYAGGIDGDHFNDPYNLLPVEARRPAYHGPEVETAVEDHGDTGGSGSGDGGGRGYIDGVPFETWLEQSGYYRLFNQRNEIRHQISRIEAEGGNVDGPEGAFWRMNRKLLYELNLKINAIEDKFALASPNREPYKNIDYQGKLLEVFGRVDGEGLSDAGKEYLAALTNPANLPRLGVFLTGVAAVYGGSHYVGVGWLADVGLVTVGGAYIVADLYEFHTMLESATTEDGLDEAAVKLNQLIVEAGGEAFLYGLIKGAGIAVPKLRNHTGRSVASVVEEAAQTGLPILNKTCFAIGTPVLTPVGHKPIEEFQVGDEILSRPENDPCISPRSSTVEDIFKSTAPVLELQVGDQLVKTTAEHPFFVENKGWVRARDLENGDLLVGHDDVLTPVDVITLTNRIETVYNLRVAQDHTYFIGERNWGFSAWVHNTYSVQQALDGTWKVIDDAGQPLREGLTDKQATYLADAFNNLPSLRITKVLATKMGHAQDRMEDYLQVDRATSRRELRQICDDLETNGIPPGAIPDIGNAKGLVRKDSFLIPWRGGAVVFEIDRAGKARLSTFIEPDEYQLSLARQGLL